MTEYKKNLVSFVVLNWNGIHDTLVCLESIRKQTHKSIEIIVVDNGSADDQKKALADIKDITFVSLPVNTGFTGGQIVGLKHSHGDYIALVNNDSVLAADWTEKALAAFKKVKKLAAVGGRAYLWNEEQGFKPFSKKNPFYSYQIVNLRTGHTKTTMHGESFTSVNSISGSGIMLKHSIVDRVGYFDNSFFAYYEETDLFARYKRAGYKIYYEPTMCTWHKIAQSTRAMPDFYLYHMHRNRFLFAVKNYDMPYLFSFFKTYAKETIRATLRILKHGKASERESVSIVKAALWNLPRLPFTLAKRRAVRKLGDSYSELLLQDASESLTIVIPCYNYADYVAEAIDSVLSQSRLPDEIIVINDGSTDNSLEVISKYADRVKIVDQKNAGIVAAKNKGFGLAACDWVLFLDADDKIKPSYIDLLTRESRLRNADITYGGMQFFGAEKGKFRSRPFSEYSLLKGNYINNSALIRKLLLVDSGGYKSEMSFGYEDWELYVTFAELGAKFAYARKALLHYRRHKESSRDSVASLKLDKAHEIVKALHPKMFTGRHRVFSILESALTFHKRRSPKQYVSDLRYLFVKSLDDKSKTSPLTTKILGFARLVKKGEYRKVGEKIKLNAHRLKNKVLK